LKRDKSNGKVINRQEKVDYVGSGGFRESHFGSTGAEMSNSVRKRRHSKEKTAREKV